MATITYKFFGAPGAKVSSLYFEDGVNGTIDETGKGTVETNISGDLNISINVQGTAGVHWVLYVRVNGKPIGYPSNNGAIQGVVHGDGSGSSKGSYEYHGELS